MGRVGDQAMRSCLCLLLALLTTTALGSWQYHLEEESDSCDEEDFLFDEEEEGCLDREIEEKEESSIASTARARSSIARVSKRGKSWGENTTLKPRWTPEATVLRLLRLCQEAEMVENGLTPNNAMLYAFTSKMKQKKFQNFPKIQRPRRRPTATLSAVYNKSAAKSLKHLKTLLLRCLLERNLLDENRQQKKIVNKKTQFLRFGRG